MEAPTCAFVGAMLSNLPRRLDGILRRHGYMLPNGAEDEIPLIKRDLEDIIDILRGHNDTNLEDHAAVMMVKCWMKEVRELWYDMEDCIDQYEHTAASSRTGSVSRIHARRKITRRRKSKPPWLPEKLKQRLWMANKIREFSVRAQEALQRHGMYNLSDIGVAALTARPCDVVSSSSLCWRRPTPYEEHVGIGAAMSKLQEWLAVHDAEDKKIKVVSIVGFGGVGKTTLANELYRKHGGQFECRAFVRTTQMPDVRRLLISMLSQLVPPHQPPHDWKVHSLISSIRTHLQDKRKCGGLPLAIVTIASQLASQLERQEQWDSVNKSLGYGLITNPTLDGMKHVINLSYINLPHHLKPCMLYLSIYQEDYIISKDDLVNQWMAEGLVCSTQEQDKGAISGSYFDELVHRRMIQPVHINDNDEVMTCMVHHMVLNLIKYKSIEENFVIAIDHSQTTTRLADRVRRLSLHFGNAEDAMAPTNMRLSQVRTLAFLGVFKCMPSIVEFRLLQVLILHFWGDEDTTSFDLTRISELFRLRYLKVTSNVNIELQTKMRSLQYLETLKIDAKASSVPPDITHLRGLLHLSLPADTNLPNGIGQMTSLRTLGYFDLSCNSMENVQSISELTNLQNLHLTCSTIQPDNLKNKMQFLSYILGKLSNLKSMTLVPTVPSYVNSLDDAAGATNKSISCDSLSSVSSPPTLLQSLEISQRICFLSSLPKWIEQLGKLCILKIGVRELSSKDVNVLRGLSVLTVLSMHVHTKPAERVIFDKLGFSVLKYFKFKCSVPLLKFEADAMPNLRKLKLGFNAHEADQHSTVMAIGIEHLSGLKEISVKIGVTRTADKLDRRSAESALSRVTRMHPGGPSINIQCVDWMFDVTDDNRGRTLEEKHRTLQKQYHTVKEGSNEKHGVLGNDSGEDANKHVHTRKALHNKWSTQVRVSSVQDDGALDDGFSWRKYGEKENPGAKYPRAYYRCTHGPSQGCKATKQVQRTDSDPLLFDVVYCGNHICGLNAQSDDQISLSRPAARDFNLGEISLSRDLSISHINRPKSR